MASSGKIVIVFLGLTTVFAMTALGDSDSSDSMSDLQTLAWDFLDAHELYFAGPGNPSDNTFVEEGEYFDENVLYCTFGMSQCSTTRQDLESYVSGFLQVASAKSDDRKVIAEQDSGATGLRTISILVNQQLLFYNTCEIEFEVDQDAALAALQLVSTCPH